MVHHEFTTFSQKDYTYNKSSWEHVGNFGLQSPSIQLNCSNFWLSQRQPLDWKKDVPNGASNCAFFGYFKTKQHNLRAIFCTRKNVFCIFLMQHPQHMFCLFLRAPNRTLFAIVPVILCFLSAFFCAPYRVFLQFFAHHFFCLKLCYCNTVSKIRIPILSAH